MIIKQSRIRNVSKLSFIEENSHIRIAVSDISRFSDKLQEIGFLPELNAGDTVLPKVIGAVSRRNADGDFIVHKDKEKETCSRMIEWSYKQWSGRGETTDAVASTVVSYKRFPRTIIPPQSIEMIVAKSNEEIIIISPEIKFNQENENSVIHIVNLFLEVFGECEVLDTKNNPILIPKVIKLNWEVLPIGKMPWGKRKSQVTKFIDSAKGSNKRVIERRLETINNYSPDFTAIGNAGFNGYVIYGFLNKNIYVLESIYVNNATYVLEDNWESISQLTKAEILNNNLHKDRAIHAKNWYEKIATILDALDVS